MTGLVRLALPFPQIAGGLGVVSLLLAGLLWVQGQRMHAAKAERDQLRREARQWQDALAAQKTSIVDLNQALDDANRQVRALGASYDRAAAQSAGDVAAADARARNMQNRVAQLDRIAQGAAAGCEVPDTLIAALEGL